ncbi:MAG TPA: GH3 auxin-responsive promoter family protein, partial [Dehalococcoidia bacterium]|nr:GH3 auxin-responsive promoter family protein [Dehalococcoidia bacterium]
MRGALPSTIDEFRKQVPITTYADYCPELLKKNESVLPAKPLRWIQTSGRSGEYPCKWVPVTDTFWQEAGLNFCAIAILGSCKHKYDIAFKKGLKLLHAASQSPCLTGAVAHKLEEDLGFSFLPPLNESEQSSFEERVARGFKMALSEGIDGFFGLAGILVAIGEKISRGSGNTRASALLRDPKTLMRLMKGKIKSKLAGRRMLPKDLWSLKVIASMGTDSVIYKDKIRELWGRAPLDVYGNTETTIIATQTWDYNHMVFFPNLNFLEFMPEEEHFKWQQDKQYTPKTVLLDEVKAGENYELVITNLHGGTLVRYRLGDMVKITALENKQLGIKLPQMIFERRADDLIDLGFMRLTERVIWQALENSGIPYAGWTARKEISGDKSKLRLFIELRKDNGFKENDIAAAVYQQIKSIDDGLYVYRELGSFENLIDFKPIEVTLLPAGVFNNYKVRRQAEGGSLAHLRPPHINPPDTILSQLVIEQKHQEAEKITSNRVKVTSSK